ncbi:probable O-methyltransferase 3 [Magnolia sinica]|uniref:probable O-methyltransferase 3 n=1 Tax=Magnolia sinica TaxID=86752 RepID=UPI00265B0CEC|nr:probable O-methyltransferase 3 [Magnolia sinica]
MTLSQLVDALSIAPARAAHVGRIMRLLVHSGFFALQKINGDQGGDEEGYVLAPPSRLLLKDTATCMSPFLLVVLDPVVVMPWHFLSTWLVGDDPTTAFKTAHGMDMWDHMAQSPRHHNLFNDAMASDAQVAMSIVVKECGLVFQGLRSLVDVGGCTGTATRAIANAFPHVKCTVFDLPHVIASMPKSKNVDMVGGDMFEPIPCADAVFLKVYLFYLQFTIPK